jgi:hypothetical protein
MLPLHRVVYVSRAVGPADSLLSIAEILAEADRNNRRDNLTGVLLGHEGRFLQVLEGTRASLDRLLRELRADPRHTEVTMLADTPIETREFACWGMAHLRITPALAPRLAGVSLDALSADQAIELLRAASDEIGAAAA